MIIDRLDLKAFGGFTDFSLDLSAGPHRFHIVYGPNESGKSTSLRAIHSFLFGFPRSTDDNYLHPNPKLRVGGVLVDDDGEKLECLRKKGTKETLRGPDDKTVIADARLSELLGGIDRETFEHRFGLSHNELVRGGMQIIQGGGDLGSILFAAGAGVDRLREVQADLEQLSQDLFKPGGTKGAINQATKLFRQQKKDLAEKQMLPAEYERRRDSLQSKRNEIAEIEAEQKQVAAELASLQRMRDAMPLIPKWNSIQEKLSEIGDVPLLDEAFIDRRRKTQANLETATSQQQELSDRLSGLNSELAESLDDAPVIVHQEKIEQLFQKLGAREEALDQCKELQKTCDRLERQLCQKLRDLKVDLSTDDANGQAIDDAVEKLRLSDAIEASVDKLALKHDTLLTQRDEAESTVDALARQLEALEKELSAADHDADPESLSELLESVGKPDDWLNRLSRQQADVAQAEGDCLHTYQRLSGIEMDFQQASQLRLPSESTIEAAATRMREKQDAIAVAKSRQGELTAQRDQVNRRLKTQQAGQPLPTLTELQQARQDRDSLLNDLSNALANGATDASQVNSLKLLVHQADQIVDAIRLHHEQVHRRSLDLAECDELKSEIEKNEIAIESAVELADAAEQEWMAIWQSIGVTADTPKRMLRWVADHEKLVAQVRQWQNESRQCAEIQKQISSSCNRLSKALQIKQLAGTSSESAEATLFDIAEDVTPDTVSLKPASLDTADLVSLYQNASSLRRRLSDAREQKIDLQKRVLDIKESLPKAQSDLQAKEKLLATWKSDWETATQSFAGDDNATPALVVELVRKINALTAQKRERDTLTEQIHSIHAGEKEFAAAVNRLAASINTDSDDTTAAENPHQFIEGLFERLRLERSESAKREALQKQVTEAESKLAKAVELRDKCQIILKQLCTEASCTAAAELIEIERRSADRSEYVRQHSETEDKLAFLAAGESIPDLVKRAGEQDAGVLEIEIETKTRLLDELKRRLSDCESERGVLQLKLDEVDAGSDSANLSQSMQLLGGQIQRDAQEYARLKIASMILQRSIEHYREENQGPVLGYAQEIFRELTCGEYTELRVEYVGNDEPTLAGVKSSDAGSLVPANLMSTGTADALYLSLRLASLRHQLSHGSRIPLIVDDCLVQLDDQRSIAALRVFAKLSLDTQVVLFTHHHHLVDLATEHLSADEFHTHQLVS